MKRKSREALKKVVHTLEQCQETLNSIVYEELDEDTQYSIELASNYLGDALTELEDILEEEGDESP